MEPLFPLPSQQVHLNLQKFFPLIPLLLTSSPQRAHPVLSSMIRTAGTQDPMTMTAKETSTKTGKVSISPTVKASKTSFYKTSVITPTPTPVATTEVPTEAPTRAFSPPVPSMTATESLVVMLQ